MDAFADRRKRYEAVLRPLGLWDAFAAIPRPLQEFVWKMKLPDPVVVFDDAARKAAERAPKGLRPAAERYLRTAKVTVDIPTRRTAEGVGGVVEIAVRDFIGVVTGVMRLCQFMNMDLGKGPAINTAPAEMRTFLEAAAPVMRRCHEAHLGAAWNEMYNRVMIALVQASRMDVRMFAAQVEALTDDRGRITTRVRVGAADAQTKQVNVDGTARPMVRAARFTGGSGEVQWVTWDGSLVPGGQPGRQYPVYVQSHALRKLHERVRLPYAGPWLDPWLGDSLAEPNVVERQGSHGTDLLVEYRIRHWRLGYLIVSPARDEDGRDCLAVRTFKLLTMANMPEARKLERKLRLSRPDLNWLRLHELESFTHTDLRSDPLLRRLMEECGCGHLFQLAEERNFAPEPKPLAAEVRKYLRMAA